MKRSFFVAILLALILMITLSGCETAPTDITDLLLPPKLTGDQLAIEKALEANIGTKYLLKYPLTGKYRTAFILHDIDGDGVDEALALYSLDNETAGTHIMVLKEVSGKWQKQCDISGDGNEVNRIEFGDYDGSGRQYLTVGWTLFNSTDLGLSVYSIQNKTLKNLYKDSFTDMAVLDMDGNGTDDILLLKLDTGSKPSLAQARLISYDEGRLKQISSAPLDSTVSSYAGVYTTKLANGKSGVYIDGYKGAHSMATELVIWKNGGLATPFFNAKSGTASSTFRDVPIDCTDIDGDSQIEIPMPVELPGYESTAYANKLWLVRWCIYNAAGKITPKLSTIINLTQGYYFQIPKSWEDNVTVQSQKNGTIWYFRRYQKSVPLGGALLFEVDTYSQAEWKALSDKSGLIRALEDNESVYAVRLGNVNTRDDGLHLPESEVLQRLRLYTPQ